MIILSINDSVYLQMLVRESGIRQNDIARDVNGVNCMVEGVTVPGFMVPSYHELLTVENVVSAISYLKSISMRDMLW